MRLFSQSDTSSLTNWNINMKLVEVTFDFLWIYHVSTDAQNQGINMKSISWENATVWWYFMTWIWQPSLSWNTINFCSCIPTSSWKWPGFHPFIPSSSFIGWVETIWMAFDWTGLVKFFRLFFGLNCFRNRWSWKSEQHDQLSNSFSCSGRRSGFV